MISCLFNSFRATYFPVFLFLATLTFPKPPTLTQRLPLPKILPTSQSSNLSFLMVSPSAFFMEELQNEYRNQIIVSISHSINNHIMTMGILIMLFLVAGVHTFVITLSSQGKSKEIPRMRPCSCQLSVVPVYDYQCYVGVRLEKEEEKWLQVYIPAQEICRNIELKGQKEVSVEVKGIDFKGETQVTQEIYVRTVSEQGECSSDGQKRVIYLVDKNQQSDFNYGIYLPHDAVLLTQCLAFLALILLCSNIKYRRISPVRFGFIFAVLYPIFLFSIVYISTYFPDEDNISYYATMLFSLVFICLYFADCFSCCSDKPFFIYSSAILAGVFLVLLDMAILVDAWFINDIIAILVTGTLTKFIVVKKMRTSIFPLLIFWVFFVFRQFAIDLRIQNFEQAMEIRIIPLFLQLPTMFSDSNIGYPCSAFGTSKIVAMGLIVNYAIRVDLFLSGHFYTLIVSITALISMILEAFVAVIISELPVVQYLSVIIFIPTASILMLLAASKRGEWAEIWHGSFHDIAVDRKSVKKDSSELNEEEINRNLEQLEMNPSLLSDS